MKATYVYEVHFYHGAYGYDAENDAVVHSPVKKAVEEVLAGKGSQSYLKGVDRLVPTGEWTVCNDRPDLLERGRGDAAKVAKMKAAEEQEKATHEKAEEKAQKVILEHNGQKYRFWEAREGFYVSGLNPEQIKALEEQGLSVQMANQTYAPCECGAFSKFRTKPVCEHCGKERKKNPVQHFVSTGEFFE